MVRLLLRLFGIKDFETCASCETLKQQLDLANTEKLQLTETLLSLVKPQVLQQNPVLIPTMESSPAGKLFSRRKIELEESNRRKNEISKDSPFVARPDSNKETGNNHVTGLQSVEEIEAKLGISNV